MTPSLSISTAFPSSRPYLQQWSLRTRTRHLYQGLQQRLSFRPSNSSLTSLQPLCKQRNGSSVLIGRTFLLTLSLLPLTLVQNRFHTWRKLWLNLAIAEKELGLTISDEAIEQMKGNLVRGP